MKILIFLVSFLSFSSAMLFDCFFDDELFFDDAKVLYTCSLPDGERSKSKVQMTNATNREVLEVTGRHKSGHDNAQVLQLHIFKHNLEYFPKGITKYFENLEAIHAGMNQIAYLEKDDMKLFPKLRFLYLYSNMLANLQSNVFEENSKLEYLSLYANQLKHIGSRILSPLKSLTIAYFNKNICIDKQAVRDASDLAEVRVEIAQKCSDITDEDLLEVLRQNQEKLLKLEEKISEMSEMMSKLFAGNRTEF